MLLGVFGVWKGRETPIGDTQAGVPELRADSRYNRDSNIITTKFSIGVDILNVIVETKEPACTSHELMTAIDSFAWHMRNVDGVQEVMSLPIVAKIAIAGWNEGSLKWRNIPREPNQLTQSTRYIETSTGLLNADCNVMPVMMFLRDHKAETIERVVAAVKAWRTQNTFAGATFNLATGNVGVMAATNEEVKAKEYPILGWVFAAVILMCLLTFRSLLGTVLVFLPLALVSILVYAVMAIVGIGLKVNTLPMVALGAGIGVDYGIYLWSRMQEYLRRRRQRARRLSQDHARHRRQHHLHRHHAGHRRGDLGVLAAAVPGRHRHHADLHVLREHAGRHHPAAGAGGVVRAAGRPPFPSKRGQPRTRA